MKLANRLVNNPDAGVITNRKKVTALDAASTTIPVNFVADSITLQERDRVLFTALSDPAHNNRVWEVEHSSTGKVWKLSGDGINPNGDPEPGEVLFIEQGTAAGQLWGFENNVWQILDLVLDITTQGVSSLNTLKGAITLAAGTNVTLTPSGNTLTINSSGGGSSPSAVLFQISNGVATISPGTTAVILQIDETGDTNIPLNLPTPVSDGTIIAITKTSGGRSGSNFTVTPSGGSTLDAAVPTTLASTFTPFSVMFFSNIWFLIN